MSNGFWKKYARMDRKHWPEKASYDELFEDLCNSGKDWVIAQNYERCADEICGELIPYVGTYPGDIYVYYENNENGIEPIFYFKVSQVIQLDDNLDYLNGVSFMDGLSIEYAGIDNKYLPIIISKLQEIDAVKNKKMIETLQKRYQNYQRLLDLSKKENYTEEELLFLYDLNFSSIGRIDVPMIKGRDAIADFNRLTDEGKAHMFIILMYTELVDKLSINSKDVIMKIAEMGYLVQLKYASDDIINDRDFIISLLNKFFGNKNPSREFNFYLPQVYQTDIGMLEYILKNSFTEVAFNILDWIRTNSAFSKKMQEEDFVYRLADAFAKAIFNSGGNFYLPSFFYAIPNDMLEDMDKHVLTEKTVATKYDNEKTLKYQEEKLEQRRRVLRREINVILENKRQYDQRHRKDSEE